MKKSSNSVGKTNRMSTRNPTWNRDELMLALELYFRFDPLHNSVNHAEIENLSLDLQCVAGAPHDAP